MKRKFFEYNTTKGSINPYWDTFINFFWGHLRIYQAYDVKFDLALSWWTDDDYRPKGNKCIQHIYRLLHICDICRKKYD